MTCHDISELLSASLDGELDPQQQLRLDDHLNTCPHCRALYQELAGLQAACQLEATPPPELKARILDSLPPQRSAKVVYWRRWGALAAALVLVALAAWRLPRPLPPGTAGSSTQDATAEVPMRTDALEESVVTEAEEPEGGLPANFARSKVADAVDPGAMADSLPADAAPADAPVAHSAPAGAAIAGNASADTNQARKEAPGGDGGERYDGVQAVLFTQALPSQALAPQEEDILEGAAVLTTGSIPSDAGAGGASPSFGGENAGEKYAAHQSNEVPETPPVTDEAELAIAAQPFEPVYEDLRDFSSYCCVLTLPQADFAQDYPRQLQPSGEMWYLLPLSDLESLPQPLSEEGPRYGLRTQGEDLTADSPYALVIVPPQQ